MAPTYVSRMLFHASASLTVRPSVCSTLPVFYSTAQYKMFTVSAVGGSEKTA